MKKLWKFAILIITLTVFIFFLFSIIAIFNTTYVNNSPGCNTPVNCPPGSSYYKPSSTTNFLFPLTSPYSADNIVCGAICSINLGNALMNLPFHFLLASLIIYIGYLLKRKGIIKKKGVKIISIILLSLTIIVIVAFFGIQSFF